MHFETGKYYHFYNRSNNEELVFKSEENYAYFLEKYRHYLEPQLLTLAYCLMPTHFHFLVRVKVMPERLNASDAVKAADISMTVTKSIGLLLSSYTKAINKRYRRHGSLFQTHSKSKQIHDEAYLLTLVSYIHQNPVRSNLAAKPEDWKFSSYQDLIGIRDGSLPDREFVRRYFKTARKFRQYSEEVVSSAKEEYRVS